jgi:hypothetical protein
MIPREWAFHVLGKKRNDSEQLTREHLNPLGEGYSINFIHTRSKLKNVKQKLFSECDMEKYP